MAKKIIKGKLYDTDTAQEVCTYWNGRTVRDFSYVMETLYKKRTGEFFIYGEGGASSKYAEPYGNMWSNGSAFRPVTEERAKAFAEENMDADKYMEFFGAVEE